MSGEVGTQPCLLHWVAQYCLLFAVDDDDMPAAQIVAVVAERRMRRFAEVSVVAGRPWRDVLVLTKCGTRAVFVSSPRRMVALQKFERRARFVRIVSGGEHGAANIVEQRGSQLIAWRIAVCNISRTRQDSRVVRF